MTFSGYDDGQAGTEEEIDVSEFASGPVTVRAETEGDAELRLNYVGFIVDTTGDGIPDEVAETDLRMPEGPTGVANSKLEIDPDVEDTSGDGLADAEQVEIDWRIEWKEAAWAESGAGDVFEAEVTDVEAHPAMADTADNNFTDAEEFEIGTEPFEWDTAGDGIADGEDPHPLVHNGWTVHLWVPGDLSSSWEHRATVALEDEFSSQIDLKVKNESRPDVEVRQMDEYPEEQIYCDDDEETLEEFDQWLKDNEEVREGDYHMLLVDCLGDLAEIIDPWNLPDLPIDYDKLFYSRKTGDLNKTPDAKKGTGDPKIDYSAGIVNKKVQHLGDERFEATVIHEFVHAAIDDSYCLEDEANEDEIEGSLDHACGGITEDGEQTPMIIANVDNIPDSEMCFKEGEPEEGRLGTANGEFTTTMTHCTVNGVESYHENHLTDDKED